MGFAIITNMLIIYFTTDNRRVFVGIDIADDYQMLMIIVFEHLLLCIRFGLKLVIPEMSLTVKAEIRIHQLTRSKRRKKLLERAQSRYRNQKKAKRMGARNRNQKNRLYSEHGSRDHSSSSNQHSLHSAQAIKSRHQTANIHIDDFVHAIY